MTIEEAILVLNYSRPNTPGKDKQFYDNEDLNNALNMAIEAIEKLEENQNSKIAHWENLDVYSIKDTTVDFLQTASCSHCGKVHTTPYMYYFDEFNFCPNCGFKMGKESVKND